MYSIDKPNSIDKSMYNSVDRYNDMDQLKLDFNKDSKHNGVIYFSSWKNREKIYLVYILDKSRHYLECLDINSISAIRNISFIISDAVEKITGLQVSTSDTSKIETFSKKYIFTSYGFLVDGKLDDSILEKLMLYNFDYRIDFKIVKVEKI